MRKKGKFVRTTFISIVMAVFCFSAGIHISSINAQAVPESQPNKVDIRTQEDYEKMIEFVRNDPRATPEDKQKFFSDLKKAMSDVNAVTSQPGSDVNCFDYYKFQSVNVSVAPTKNTYNSGDHISFVGTVKNNNSYPIFDGNIYVRIGKINPNYISEGNFAVDEFVAVKNIALDKDELKPINFTWTAPPEIVTGEYNVDFFFSVGKKFNLGGLPFTNEIISSKAQFSVNSKSDKPVYLSRDNTKINGEKYNQIGVTPRVEFGEKMAISQPILNTSSAEKNIKIQYDLYWWDSLYEKDKISSSSEEVTLPAQSSKTLNYDIQKVEDSIYYLKITSDADGERSIVNIRMSSEKAHPRMNFPAINKFPIRKGDQATLFSCFHNTSNQEMNGSVTLSAFDKSGTEIGKMEYNGIFNVYMAADKKEFIAGKNLDWIRLEAKLQDEQGKIIDSYSAVYDCRLLGEGKCLGDDNGGDSAADLNSATPLDEKNTLVPIGAGLAVILIVFLSWLIYKRKKKSSIVSPGNSKKFLLMFLIILAGLLYTKSSCFAFQVATSTTISPATVTYPYVTYEPDYTPGYGIVWDMTYYWNCSVYPSVAAYYYVSLSKTTYTSGQSIQFSYSPYDDIGFWGSGACTYTGYSCSYGGGPCVPVVVPDTPYGVWCSNLNSRCSGGQWWDTGQGVSVTVTAVKPSSPYVTSSDPSIVKCWESLDRLRCDAISPGTVTLTTHIPSTQGAAWNGDTKADTFTLPEATVDWAVNVVSSSARPTVSISCDSPVAEGTKSNCTVTGFDTDNQYLKYEMDWDSDGTPNWESGTSWAGLSGTPHTFTKPNVWDKSGDFIVSARALEYNLSTPYITGQSSDWKGAPVKVQGAPIPGQCKSPPNNQTKCPPYATNPPFSTGSSDLCDATGSIPVVIENSGDWTWDCTGQNGGSDAPDGCHVLKGTAIPPECGTANGQYLCSGLGSLSWCAADNSIIGEPKVDGYDTSWQCRGSCTSELPVNCSAKGKKSCGWFETNP
jgi:hypothetical protein